MNYPQQGYVPQQPQLTQMQPPAPMAGAAAAVQAQADQNAWAEIAAQPKRTPVNRQRIDDGDHHIQLTKVELKPSNKDNRLFLLWEFTIVASTVDAAVGQSYGYPMFLGNRYQLQDMADVCKDIWGEETVRQWAASGVGPFDSAAYIGSAVTGMFCTLNTKRAMKDGATYDTAFINHLFRTFVQDPSQLPALPQKAAPVGMLQGAAPSMPMPGGIAQAAPQAPAMPQAAPQAPAMPQAAPQAPAMPQAAPQAPAMPMPPAPSQFPQ